LDRRRLFGWIGVAGVLSALVAVVVVFFHLGHVGVFVPAALLLLVAAVGGAIARSRARR
jgi:hypothetical protein